MKKKVESSTLYVDYGICIKNREREKKKSYMKTAA